VSDDQTFDAVLTSNSQIQERHVGENLERNGAAMAGCRGNALADRRGRNGTACQRPGLPSCWPAKHIDYRWRHSGQQIQHIARLCCKCTSTRTRIFACPHSQPQPAARIASDGLVDFSRAGAVRAQEQRWQLASRRAFVETSRGQRTFDMPHGCLHTKIRAGTPTSRRDHNTAVQIPSPACCYIGGSGETVLKSV